VKSDLLCKCATTAWNILLNIRGAIDRPKGIILIPVDSSESTLTLYTYAFLTGWGAFLEQRTVSEVWEECHLEEHIHLLEMRTVIL
jgi:hypothetical protein